MLVVTQDQDGKTTFGHLKQVDGLHIESCLRTTVIVQEQL